MNSLFEGELTEDDQLVYVREVLKTKLLESTVLTEQAANNTKEQFAASPDLKSELQGAIMDAFDAHQTRSKQALASDKVQSGLLDILLSHLGLWEALKSRGERAPSSRPGAELAAGRRVAMSPGSLKSGGRRTEARPARRPERSRAAVRASP